MSTAAIPKRDLVVTVKLTRELKEGATLKDALAESDKIKQQLSALGTVEGIVSVGKEKFAL